jgi:hypothetical protein
MSISKEAIEAEERAYETRKSHFMVLKKALVSATSGPIADALKWAIEELDDGYDVEIAVCDNCFLCMAPGTAHCLGCGSVMNESPPIATAKPACSSSDLADEELEDRFTALVRRGRGEDTRRSIVAKRLCEVLDPALADVAPPPIVPPPAEPTSKPEEHWTAKYRTPENICAACSHARSSHLDQPFLKGEKPSSDRGWCTLPPGTCIFSPCSCKGFVEPIIHDDLTPEKRAELLAGGIPCQWWPQCWRLAVAWDKDGHARCEVCGNSG